MSRTAALILHRRSAEPPPPPTGAGPANALAADLRAALAGEVRFDAGSRALYATDASNYRQVPIGVVIPRHVPDVIAAVHAARRHAAPVFGRGAATSLAGQCCNTAVVLDFSKYMHAIIGIDPASRTARVQPGVVLDQLRGAAAPAGLTFGPDPATHAYCTFGGMIGNNSCGVRSVMAQFYGPGPTTADNVEALDVLTYRGVRLRLGAMDDVELQRTLAAGGPGADLLRGVQEFQERYADLIRREFPRIPRRVSGYNLPALLPENGFHVARALVGSESTLALTLEATVRLLPSMPERVLVVLGFDDVFVAADHVPEVMVHEPIGLEGFDERLVEDLRRSGLHEEYLRLLPRGAGWLLVEFGADSRDAAFDRARQFAASIRRAATPISIALFDKPEDQQKLWELRESGLAATAHTADGRRTFPGWEDSAVGPEDFGSYLREISKLFEKHGYRADLYGHFGQGCLHSRVDFDLHTPSGLATFRTFMQEAADLVHGYGGSLSGEHGDGQARGALLARMFSPEMLQAFREFKAIWDPDWKMNPGKVVEANPIDADLRLGPAYHPPEVHTAFAFTDDAGSFARATTRCVGVGKCRKMDAGTMCPSYMVTREEMHSTRGRAHLLFEMLEGDPLHGGWQSRHVREALDLCLACKGCKQECPVHVDMATYKAEFLSHYYQRHWRPRSAYAFAHIRTWARLARYAPRLVNLLARAPGLRRLANAAAGIAPQRTVPPFATQTFSDWFAQRPRQAAGGPRVILWPDTFNDHFHPQTLKAALDVLEVAGYSVAVPAAPLCCGRPLYDCGMLGLARRRLETVMGALETEIDAGIRVVMLEPSCASVFRDELTALFPGDARAERLQRQTVTLAELLVDTEVLPSLSLGGRVLLHGHCHHKAVMGMDADRSLLDRGNVDFEVIDSGCCGMAGAFGFEREHYDVSVAIGERVLLPAVRAAAPDTFVVTDGFSCREQIAQSTGRRALHLAELLRIGMAGTVPVASREADATDDAGAAARTRSQFAGALLVVGGLATTAWALRGQHARRRRRARRHRPTFVT